MISVTTVDLFNSLHVRQNNTTCTSVQGLSRLIRCLSIVWILFSKTHLFWVNNLILTNTIMSS